MESEPSSAPGKGRDEAAGRGGVSRMLESPVVGMAPWIVFSVLVGPGRFEPAVLTALACVAVLVVGGRIVRRGTSWKLLEVSDVVFFAVMALVGAFASPGTHRWLETYAGEVANVALVVIAFGSMALRTPFTLQYAREQVDRAYWHSPVFLRTNDVITGVWGLAFLVAAVAGAYGDLVLRNPNNLWTGWIIQIAAIVAALRFTTWYPAVVRARAAGGPRRTRSVAALLLPVAGLLVPAGVVVLIFDSALWWLGIALIFAGGVLTRSLHHRSRPATDPDRA
ncbi:hypothetical protein [Streptomyces sp. NPDC051567]|uniref:hypothetical protein n=1 Tax=Streptomyces sp. NPDC051567 TaxID=3365660 RepID=UPI00379F9750